MSTLHCLGLDGVYVRDERGSLEFHELPTPSTAEVREIARRTARRLHAAFVKQGRKSHWDDEADSDDSGKTEPFSLEQPGLFACYQAAVWRWRLRRASGSARTARGGG